MTNQNISTNAQEMLQRFARPPNQEAWCIADHNDDELYDLVRSLHDGELPNDWRYDCIHWILNAISSESTNTDWEDIPHQYADHYVDIGTQDLYLWIANCPARADYIQQARESGFIDGSMDHTKQIQVAQYLQIESMTHELLRSLA